MTHRGHQPKDHWRLLVMLPLLLASACARPPVSDEAGEKGVTLVDLGERPQDFRERTVLTRGWLVSKGEAPEGLWLALAVSPATMAQAQSRGGTIGLPDGIIILLPIGAARDIVDGAEGKELELLIRVVGQVKLWDGRTALLVVPLQLATIQRFDEPAQ